MSFVSLFLMVFDKASINDGSAPNLAGRSSSIPTNFSSQILCAILAGTGGEAAPTKIASVGGATLLVSEAKERGGVARERYSVTIGVVLEDEGGHPGKLILPVFTEVNRGTLLSSAPPGSSPTCGKAGCVPVDVLVNPVILGRDNPPPAPEMDEGVAPGPGVVALETASCTILSIDEDMAIILAAMALLIMACKGVARTVFPPPGVGVTPAVDGVPPKVVVPVAEVS